MSGFLVPKESPFQNFFIVTEDGVNCGVVVLNLQYFIIVPIISYVPLGSLSFSEVVLNKQHR